MNLKKYRLYIAIHLTFIFIVAACAMGGKVSRDTTARKDQDRLWRPCQDFEDRRVGMVCTRRCIKRKRSGKCESWQTKKRNFCESSDFQFFRSGSFVFIDEDNFL